MCRDSGEVFRAESRARAGLKVDHFKLHAAPTLPFVEGGGEDNATFSVRGHEFVDAIAEVEPDRS
jgi:hypothetical protein